jgi:hypothetical protein
MKMKKRLRRASGSTPLERSAGSSEVSKSGSNRDLGFSNNCVISVGLLDAQRLIAGLAVKIYRQRTPIENRHRFGSNAQSIKDSQST